MLATGGMQRRLWEDGDFYDTEAPDRFDFLRISLNRPPGLNRASSV